MKKKIATVKFKDPKGKKPVKGFIKMITQGKSK